MLRLLIFAFCLFTPYSARAEDQREPFEVPPPRPAAPTAMPIIMAPSLPRPGTREIWQYYGVDKSWPLGAAHDSGPVRGVLLLQWRARYPYTTAQPSLFMPYVVD